MFAYMNGTTVTGTAPAITVAPGWQIAGTADFNADANPDQVWRRTSDGVTFALLMSGVNVSNVAKMFSVPDVNWRPVAFADLNGDGKPDLVLWNQASGLLVVLYQDGVTIIGGAVLPTVTDVTWSPVEPR
jgi:hypothetical protein